MIVPYSVYLPKLQHELPATQLFK